MFRSRGRKDEGMPSMPVLKLSQHAGRPLSPRSHSEWTENVPTESDAPSDNESSGEDCETPKAFDRTISDQKCPSPPRKRRAAAKRQGPPSGGFFSPPDLESFLSFCKP